MGCGCKNVKKIEDKYGVKEKVGFLNKIINSGVKIGLFSLTMLLSFVIAPIILVVGLFKAFFMKDKMIKIPKFITRIKKSVNG